MCLFLNKKIKLPIALINLSNIVLTIIENSIVRKALEIKPDDYWAWCYQG
jgi:hypothetical protein